MKLDSFRTFHDEWQEFDIHYKLLETVLTSLNKFC